jgi:3-deoxy-7-phosphoheptulonate synthase
MLIVMHTHATPENIAGVCDRIRELGWIPNEIPGSTRLAIGITGNKGAIDPTLFNRRGGCGEQTLQAGQPGSEAG